MGGKSNCFWPEKPLRFSISARKSLRISAKTFFFLEIICFWSEKPLRFSISARKSLRISAKTFFYFYFLRSPVFGRKNRLDFRFQPEKAFGSRGRLFFFSEITCFWSEKPPKFSISARKSLRISAKTLIFFSFFGDHLIFTEISPQSNSGTMKIWVKFVYGTNSQKILSTCLFFIKVQSTLKKRPPMPNFTI